MGMVKILSVAGSDSGGGAGIQADVRTASMLGCHASTAITAITAQNSLGVQGIYPLSPEAVAAQMESVLSDIGADAAKTGMLFDAPIIETVASVFGKYAFSRLVVDPVMVAKGGSPLLKDEAKRALVEKLFPLALLVTPNIPEAEALSGVALSGPEGARKAALKILETGPRAVLIKGGHGEGQLVVDRFYSSAGEELEFVSPRVDTPHTHGTGCTLSAAIAANLALGRGLAEAVGASIEFLHRAVEAAYPTGSGHGSTNPCLAAGCGEGAVIERLHRAWEIIEEANPWGLIPEVQSNLAEALPGATSFSHVAAFPGRIIRSGGKVRRVDGPRFGASRHMAKILLASARRGSPYRAVMNVRYGADVLEALKRCGFECAGFSRKDEPGDVKAREGSTLEWGTGRVLDELGRAPDAIFDEGDEGKEPMIRIFGIDALDAAGRVARVWRDLHGGK